MRALRMIAIFMTVVMATSILGACEGGGSTRVSYSLGMGYGGYYGRAPYGYYRPPVIIGGPGPDIDQPVAVPLPEPDMDFGMPEAGFDDFGDFDF